MPIHRKQIDNAARSPDLNEEENSLTTEKSEFNDGVFDNLNEEELSALFPHEDNKIPSDREADDPIRRWMQERFAYLDNNGSQPEKARFEIDEPLPTIIIQQNNGDFLSKFTHDANIEGGEGVGERNGHKPIVLMLNKTRQGFSYLQPYEFRRQMTERGISEAAIERDFRRAGIPLALTDEKQPIDHQTMIRSPADPDRFIEAGDLRRQQPEAMIQAKDVFVQNGYTGRDFEAQLTGNFTDLMSRIRAKDPNKRHLIGSQYNLVLSLKSATAEAMSKPDFVWPSHITIPERKDLAKQSLFRDLEISDDLLDRIGLRLTYRASSNDISHASPFSDDSEGIPYEAPKAMPLTTTTQENGFAGSASLKRSRYSTEQQEAYKRLRSRITVSDERDASAFSPPQMQDNPTATKRRRSSDDVTPPNKRARAAAPKLAGFLRLPDELIGEVGTYLVTDDADTTARALKPLRLVSHRVDDAIRGARPGYANTVYQRAIPKGPFAIMDISCSESSIPSGHDDQSDIGSALDDTSRPMTAADRLRSIGPILKRHSDEHGSEVQKRQWNKRRSELVEKILNISDLPQQAEAIAATAPYIEAFSNEDRSRLFDGVVKAINEVDDINNPEHRLVWYASKSFLETTWPHMQEEDHIKITGDFEADHPISLPTFNNRYVIDLIQTNRDPETPRLELEWLAVTPREASPTLEEEERSPEQSSERSPSMTRLSRPMLAVANDTEQSWTSSPIDGEDQSPSTAIGRLGRAVQQISGTSDDARQALLNNRDTTRDRERSR